ncbi:hypothetical protein AJ80_06962 [Polytolypa hystricis UAMH7299]|uniref:Uncharacterized protein n=1 Tax=Polytolypa hystricis (strain UAMH7299) TaxID=1447883 RepID=A0A2B7XJ89_POLH7|nr:hypothetical protein AJ80_06962 [Polytolypa hystricis UAMH7299]
MNDTGQLGTTATTTHGSPQTRNPDSAPPQQPPSSSSYPENNNTTTNKPSHQHHRRHRSLRPRFHTQSLHSYSHGYIPADLLLSHARHSSARGVGSFGVGSSSSRNRRRAEREEKKLQRQRERERERERVDNTPTNNNNNSGNVQAQRHDPHVTNSRSGPTATGTATTTTTGAVGEKALHKHSSSSGRRHRRHASSRGNADQQHHLRMQLALSLDTPAGGGMHANMNTSGYTRRRRQGGEGAGDFTERDDGLTDVSQSTFGDSGDGGKGRWLRRRENVTMEDVRRQRERRAKEEDSNRQTLSSLATLSTEITRHLENTYYNLLEKISNLHSIIHSFHDLTTLSTNLNRDFARETLTLESDTRRHIDDLGAFEPQVRRLEGLEERMRKGAGKAAALRERLDIVEGRIEAWNRREVEWQKRMSGRLRILWAGIVLAVVVMLGVWAVEKIRAPTEADGMAMGMRGIIGVQGEEQSGNISMAQSWANTSHISSSNIGASNGNVEEVFCGPFDNAFDAAGGSKGEKCSVRSSLSSSSDVRDNNEYTATTSADAAGQREEEPRPRVVDEL